MLYGRHMGFKGHFEKLLAEHDPKAIELNERIEELKKEATQFMRVRAVWQFFEAERDGNSIHLFAPDEGSPIHTFHFGRQRRNEGLCLSDYVLPSSNGQRDHIALFVVTAGQGVRSKSEAAKAAGQYVKSHGLQALAIETAEACAEWVHRRLREDWGFPDPRDDHATTVHFPLPRKTLQLRLPCLPQFLTRRASGNSSIPKLVSTTEE
jgi:5-methyltetrahydrofolate--homocysteine methyltransferase